MSYFLKRLIRVFCVLSILLNCFGLILDELVCNNQFFKSSVIYNTKNIENIILGSSRSLTGINAEYMKSISGRNWYNLSVDDTELKFQLAVLNFYLETNKNPNYIILEFSTFKKSSSQVTDKDYILLPFIWKSKSIDNYFKSKEHYFLYKYLPIFKYVFFNLELLYPTIYSVFNGDFKYKFNDFGDFSYPIAKQRHVLNNKVESVILDLKNEDLLQFRKLCESRKIKYKIVVLPILNSKMKLAEDSTVLNLSMSFNDSQNLYYDKIHLNSNGSKIFTELLDSLIFH